ncbi:hypothetical protein LOZ58_005136 [Ophidiomyces ophidiicola]|nr:hypothetical protein LOZ65_005706 [Ophidiomyces ophidiicola]KAI1935256.1 hypothetical protein LOZ66_005386 [Ophidiomyces ophidiicola]KAI1958404.1 hypothetical protein LOZ58_005136 [Ophidiomyces ophidiicola]
MEIAKLLQPEVLQNENSLLRSGEELVLEGGQSTTGHRAELAGKQNDVSIPLRTGELHDRPKAEPSVSPVLKRSLSMESQRDSAMRSMPRRNKDAPPPLDINRKCDHCDKVFRRLWSTKNSTRDPGNAPSLRADISPLVGPINQDSITRQFGAFQKPTSL